MTTTPHPGAAPEMGVTTPVVIVMVKAPVPGTVKTRLTPALSIGEASALAAAFARDTVANLPAEAAVLVAYAPADGRVLLESLLPRVSRWTAQGDGDLGRRMDRAMAEAQSLGFGPLLVTGTDSPARPPSDVRRAIAVLRSGEADVVLGPTEDGGYHLVGAAGRVPSLFDGVAWSTAQALAHTAANAARLGLRCRRLPARYDVDTPADLARLRREIGADAALACRIPSAAEWVRANPHCGGRGV